MLRQFLVGVPVGQGPDVRGGGFNLSIGKCLIFIFLCPVLGV